MATTDDGEGGAVSVPTMNIVEGHRADGLLDEGTIGYPDSFRLFSWPLV